MTNNTNIPDCVSPAVEEWCLQVCKFSREIRCFELLRSYIRLLPKSIQHSCKSILWHTQPSSWCSEAMGCAPNHWWKGKDQGSSNSSRLTNSMYDSGKNNIPQSLVSAGECQWSRQMCDVLAHLIAGRTVLFTPAREECC